MKYAVTINCNHIEKGKISTWEYLGHVSKMRKAGELRGLAYEIGKQGRCHLHATWETDLSGTERHKLLRSEGYYYDCKPVRNERAWESYKRKDQPKETTEISVTVKRLV